MDIIRRKEYGVIPKEEEHAMIDSKKYRKKYRRFVQGLISEDEFRRYLTLSLSKKDLTDLIVSGAKSLRKAVAIGEAVEIER